MRTVLTLMTFESAIPAFDSSQSIGSRTSRSWSDRSGKTSYGITLRFAGKKSTIPAAMLGLKIASPLPTARIARSTPTGGLVERVATGGYLYRRFVVGMVCTALGIRVY